MKAEFVTSAVDAEGFPKERLPELAFAGRSNVGKSSLINALVGQKVARTSAAPGKTRLANFYRVTPDRSRPFFLVDLPGYGYARGGDEAKREFAALTNAYFAGRLHGSRGAGRGALHGGPPALSERKRVEGSERNRVEGSEQRESKGGPLTVGRGPKSSPFAGVLLLVDGRHPGLAPDRQAWDWLQHLDIGRIVVATKLDKLTRADRVRHLNELERLHDGLVLGVSAQTGEGLKELWKTIDALLRPLQPGTPPTR